MSLYLFVLTVPYIQLIVTVTLGLPPLLANESYQCQLADRERLRVITVNAEEVTPNTTYQCNITGRIPTFTGVQLGKMYYGAACVFINISDCRYSYHTTVTHNIHEYVDGLCVLCT